MAGSGGVARSFFSAHRVAWELANGPIPGRLFVLRRCDNRLCVNPEHLFLGTQSDNMRDMAAKGRRECNGADAMVRRELGERIRALSVPMPPDLRARLEAKAEREDRSVASVVRRLVTRGLESEREGVAA
jgi:HNH endonuclease